MVPCFDPQGLGGEVGGFTTAFDQNLDPIIRLLLRRSLCIQRSVVKVLDLLHSVFHVRVVLGFIFQERGKVLPR